ncbi:cell death-inducing p53-target protein 1 homolog [Bolinopsis microptera]|uniref:cell death-inducing p53-target protein 1 homolog n=1 Tax=Bolinopsis microptera TaxID=2820187 RepID=UPI00307A1240
MADQQQRSTPPPPYEGPYHDQAGTAPAAPPSEELYPQVSQPTGYGTDQSATYPAQAGYPVNQYPINPEYESQEKTPLVGVPHPEVVHQTPTITNTVVIPAQSIVWSKHPTHTFCLTCQNTILTQIEFITGTFTWLIVGIILLVGGWFMCCIIPFFADSCKDVVHKCPHCHVHIHTWNRL